MKRFYPNPCPQCGGKVPTGNLGPRDYDAKLFCSESCCDDYIWDSQQKELQPKGATNA